MKIVGKAREIAVRTRHLLLAVTLTVAVQATLSVAPAAAGVAPAPGFKALAVTGPTHLPPLQSELQRVTLEAEGGTFELSYTIAGEGTLGFASGAVRRSEGSNQLTVLSTTSGAFVRGMTIPASAGIPAGTTITGVSGSTLELSAAATTTGVGAISASSKEVTEVSSAAGEFHAGDPISGTGIPVGTTIASAGDGSLVLSQFPTAGGTVALTSTEISGPIAYDASAGTFQGALETMPAFAGQTVLVTGGPGGDAEHPWNIDFSGRGGAGPYALKDVGQLVADGDSLVGPQAYIHVSTVVPGGDGTGQIGVYIANVGAEATAGTVTAEIGPLPTGVSVAGPTTVAAPNEPTWTCSAGSPGGVVTCTESTPIPALKTAGFIAVPVTVETPLPFKVTVPVRVSGGGAPQVASTDLEVDVSSEPAKAGVAAFWAGAFEADGSPSTQAGGHPHSALTMVQFNSVRSGSGQIIPAGDAKEIRVDLPPGFVGSPLVTGRCPQSLVAPLENSPEPVAACNDEEEVGVFQPVAHNFPQIAPEKGIFNDVPAGGTAAEFSLKYVAPVQSLIGSVRSEDDYGVRIAAPNVATFAKLFTTYVGLFGEPTGAHGAAFLRNPTDCAQQAQERSEGPEPEGSGPRTHIEASTWQEPTVFEEDNDPLPLLTGCQALTESWLGHGSEPRKPSFEFQPTTTQGSSGTGATARLHIDQEGLSTPSKLATSDLKKVVVTLPQGLTLNPSSANGLEACSEAQIGYSPVIAAERKKTGFTNATPTCPDASKLGTVEATSPLLEEPVEGTIYLAAQEENPFNSLIALYLDIESPRFGLTVKLPGEVTPDPNTGQLTATFDNNPQLPVEDLTLHFRGGGPRSELATPEVCGHFASTGALTPWSAEHGEAAPIEEPGFDVSGGCASSADARPFGPSFEAGTTGTQAGAYSPLVIKVDRRDGEQELRRLDFTLPKGLTGKLAGIPYCPDSAISEAEGKTGKAEQAAPSCPATSRIGSVDTAAGVGAEPIHVAGSVYLAGPYEGAPLSSVVVTPAVAGPFDLGDVVVRAPLFVNPETTEITAKSDPIPTILRGIPLKVRSVSIYLDRSDFTLNPTSCEVASLTATIAGSSGATAGPANRFQVGGCNQLKFKPKLKVSLRGSTKRTGLPALKAVVTYPKQGAYANIARAQVNLPHAEFLEQNNLNKTCTKPVLLEGNCSKRTIYGKAKAWTPLLDKPLEGPVYLVGGYGYKLPALVAELNGQIRILLKGKVDSGPNRGIRNTFEAVPDAPVSRFVLEMKGGKKYGLLINSENLCKKQQRANVRFTAQNGLVDQYKPLIANQCGKKKPKRGGKRKNRKR